MQSRQYYALASNKLVTANIRFIAATNADLAAMVDVKRFREDLFYRINVISIRMPSLFERREDVGVLTEELIKRVSAEHRLPALPVSERLRAHLEAGDWPGNVRQLRHRIEGALIRAAAEGAPQMEIRHLAEAAESPGKVPTFHAATRQFQRDFLRKELSLAGWNVTAVAEKLDLTRSHVYNLIHQFDLKRTDK